MVMNVTPEEKQKFKELNRLRMKTYRDRKRQRKYAPRGQYKQQPQEEKS